MKLLRLILLIAFHVFNTLTQIFFAGQSVVEAISNYWNDEEEK